MSNGDARPKVAVVGAGGWGANHVRTFYELGALGAVADVDPKRRRAVAEQYPGVQLLEGPEQVWDSDWSAVVLATPVPTHFDLAKQALVAGKDVFVEKPLTLRTHEAEELVHLAEKRGRVLMVGHLLLFQPAIRWLKQQLDAGLVGQVISLHQERLSLGRVRTAENALWSLGVHDIAVLLYLVGEAPSGVSAIGHASLQPGIEDDVYVHLNFGNNVQAHLHCSWLWPERRRGLTAVGTEGMLVYDELDQTVTLHRKRVVSDLTIRDEGEEVVFKGDGQPLTLECEHFLDAIQYRTRPVSDGRSGVEVVRVLEQAQGFLASARELKV